MTHLHDRFTFANLKFLGEMFRQNFRLVGLSPCRPRMTQLNKIESKISTLSRAFLSYDTYFITRLRGGRFKKHFLSRKKVEYAQTPSGMHLSSALFKGGGARGAKVPFQVQRIMYYVRRFFFKQ